MLCVHLSVVRYALGLRLTNALRVPHRPLGVFESSGTRAWLAFQEATLSSPSNSTSKELSLLSGLAREADAAVTWSTQGDRSAALRVQRCGQDDLIDKLVCLSCLTVIDGDGDNVLRSSVYSYICPSCNGWIRRTQSGRTDTCECCRGNLTDYDPIIRVTFDDPRGGSRKSYKVDHADGAACWPPVYAPGKAVPCTLCDSKKGDRHDLSGGERDPKKAMCKKCFTKFRATFTRSSIEQARAQSTSSGSTSDYYSPSKRNRAS